MRTTVEIMSYGVEIRLVVEYETQPAEPQTLIQQGHDAELNLMRAWHEGDPQDDGHELDLLVTECEVIESLIKQQLEQF